MHAIKNLVEIRNHKDKNLFYYFGRFALTSSSLAFVISCGNSNGNYHRSNNFKEDLEN